MECAENGESESPTLDFSLNFAEKLSKGYSPIKIVSLFFPQFFFSFHLFIVNTIYLYFMKNNLIYFEQCANIDMIFITKKL